MDDKTQHWMQTYTGRQFFPFAPERSDVVIEDIAHHLSLLCRFTGACRVHYSVAQHCVVVSQLVPAEFAFEGLMHDAAEAYTNDMARPHKKGLPDFKSMEAAIEARIAAVFHLPTPMPACVKHSDEVAVATEARDLMANAPTLWQLGAKAFVGIRIEPMPALEAERAFLDRYRELAGVVVR